MKKALFIFVVFMGFSIMISSLASAETLQVKLKINNTNNIVYVPGTGEIASSSLTNTTYTSPHRYFLSSHLNNVLKGLVFYYKTPASIETEIQGSNHYIKTNQSLSESKVLLVFTRGDWQNIENRMISIEAGRFLQSIEPSFGYGLGLYYPIKIMLRFSNIDIQTNLIMNRGSYDIVIQSNMTGSQQAVTIRSEQS